MGLGEVVEPAKSMFGGAIGRLARYSWVLWAFVIIAGLIGAFWIWNSKRQKDAQWTHKLKVRRVLQNNLLSDPTIIRMRRFPIIKRAEVFELEKPLLGGYLIPELESYSGVNEYSIILDINNRIYTNKGEYFNKDDRSVNVSAKHSEIDIARSELRANFQDINAVKKRIEWGTIAKYLFLTTFILAVMVVTIVAIDEWGEAQNARAEEAQGMARAMSDLAEAMGIIDGTVNTQAIIIDKLKNLEGTNNIQTIVRRSINETS